MNSDCNWSFLGPRRASSEAFNREWIGVATDRGHQSQWGSSPGAATEVSLLYLQKVAWPSFFRKANRPQQENICQAKWGASWGCTAWVGRTVSDCGASSNGTNGSIIPWAVKSRACNAGMLNTAGMLFVFINTTMYPHTDMWGYTLMCTGLMFSGGLCQQDHPQPTSYLW